MNAVDAARAFGASRVFFGTAMIAAPSLAGRGWIGEHSGRPAVHPVIRGFGVRDVILGGLAMHVAGRPGVGSRTLATCALADATDFAATLAVRDHLPRAGSAGILALAGSATVAGLALAAALRGNAA